jgi:hypothetical protein
MKKFLIIIGILVVLGLALIATCPDRDAHREAVKSVLSAAINAEMDQSNINETMAAISTMFAVSAIDSYLSSNLVVRDRTFYNVGVVSYEGDFHMVSVGVFNHVFTISEDDARQFVKERLKKILP